MSIDVRTAGRVILHFVENGFAQDKEQIALRRLKELINSDEEPDMFVAPAWVREFDKKLMNP